MLQSLLTIYDSLYEKDGNWYFINKAESLIYALIGFLVVILGIVILIGIIWLLGLIMRKTNNLAFITERKSRNKNKKVEKEVAANALPEKVPEVVSDDGDIPDEVKAAIIAAIMAYYQEQDAKCEFTVKRIKRL